MAKINFFQGQTDLLELMQDKDVESLKDEQTYEIALCMEQILIQKMS